MAKKVTTKTKSVNTKKVLRFAHPFYTNVPQNKRENIPGVGKRMNDYVIGKLEPIPDPIRDPTITLAEIIGDEGVSAIEKYGSISFHATGDTGNEKSDWPKTVSDAMSKDYNASKPEESPAFFFHLGDVNYYDNTDEGYHSQFYEPYKAYPGKIIAIPGNHDGELFKYDNTSVGQKTTLEAFMENFCQPKPAVPPAALTIYREMISQPGVYWYLNAPFVDIIGLYSNIAEGQGFISGPDTSIGQKQKDWLVKTLKAISNERTNNNRKALIIAVHHPPYSNGGHEPSTIMLNDIDDACNQGAIMPDAVLTAHAHSYQGYTRYITFKGKNFEIPFTVNGCGGRGLQPPKEADGSRNNDAGNTNSYHTYDKSYNGYGYQLITASKSILTIEFFQVDQNGNKESFHKIQVDLSTNKVIK